MSPSGRSATSAPRKTKKTDKWVRRVTTESTYPPAGLYTKDAETIARVMARRSVSPKGIGSAIRMVQFFINRAGTGLTADRRKTLERAKRILQQRLRSQKERPSPARSRRRATEKR